MEFDFEVVHRPGTHHQATDALFQLLSAFLGEGGGGEAHFNGKIFIDFILRQDLNAENIKQKERPAPLDVPSTAELHDAQQTDVFCQYAANHIRTNLRSKADDQELILRIAPIDE